MRLTGLVSGKPLNLSQKYLIFDTEYVLFDTITDLYRLVVSYDADYTLRLTACVDSAVRVNEHSETK